MNYLKIIPILLVISLIIPSGVFASSVVRTGEAVSVEADQKIEGDFYTAGSVLSVSGEIAEDYLSAAGRNTLNGKVGKDAFMIGGVVDVHGPVGEDLRVIGADVVIAEPVTGDVFVIGETVKILSTASIGGDLVVYGGVVEVSGSVGGNIIGHYETLRIDAPVAKGIDVTVKQLTLGDRADITENVQYASTEQLTRAQNTKVGGTITRNDVVTEGDSKSAVRVALIMLLVVLFSVLAWFLVARSVLSLVVSRSLIRGMRPILIGFVTLIAGPVIIAVLLASIIGSIVGVVGLFGYLLLILLALLGSIAVLGTLAQRVVQKNHTIAVTPLSLVIGVITVALLIVIPIVGALIIFVTFLITLGALVDIILRPTLS